MSGAMHTQDWSDIPVPVDDGAARHLRGSRIASVALPATNGERIDLSAIAGRVVVYAFPRTSRPGVANPDGWQQIPGAFGCTAQSSAFGDHLAELKALGVARVFGLSTQDTDYQREAVERLHLPFPMLSDAGLMLARAIKLPTFQVDGRTLLKRLTLIISDGVIGHVFYPVFPPDQNARDVVAWLSRQA